MAGLYSDQNVEIEKRGDKHGQAWYQQVPIDLVQGGFKIFIGEQQADVKWGI